MPADAKKFSLLVIDENQEVRECLSELFRGADFEVIIANNSANALLGLPAGEGAGWPDVIILGHLPGEASPQHVLDTLGERRPEALRDSSVIVFPSFRVTLGGEAETPAKHAQACRLSTVANLLTLVRGLAQKRLTAVQAS